MNFGNTHRVLGVLLAATVATSSAWSQNTGPAEPAKPAPPANPANPTAPTKNTDPVKPAPPATPPATTDPNGLLSGPKVNEEPGSGGPRRDGQGFGQGERRPGERTLEFLGWYRIVQSQNLTPDQKTKIDAIADEYRAAMKGFQEQYGQQLQELRAKANEAKESGKKRDPALMQEREKITSMAPKPGPYQERAWALLDDAQKEAVTKRLDELKQQMAERRARQRGDGPGDPNMTRDPGSPDAGTKGPQPDDHAKRRREFLKAHQGQPGTPPPPPPPAPAPPTP